ncbi:hypothetical protein SLS64_010134 [Diaporthe eres]|uniref:Bromo domain-containing protein n=1 Tax=Diaporthe eres TaxID=83184 RepID=A0ABR1NWG3_DIAER
MARSSSVRRKKGHLSQGPTKAPDVADGTAPGATVTPEEKRKVKRMQQSRDYENNHRLEPCKLAFNELLSDKYADCNVHFLKPLHQVELKLPQYMSIFKVPMYLSTMKEAVEAGKYEHASEFKKDFMRILETAKLFNVADSAVHEAANKLKREFKVVWKEAKQSKKSEKTAVVENEDQQKTRRSKRKSDKTAAIENEGRPETKRSKKRSE